VFDVEHPTHLRPEVTHATMGMILLLTDN